MKNQILVLVLLMLALSVAFSQQKKTANSTCKGDTQSELDVCAGEEFKLADAELNRVYQQLLKTVASDKLATSKIRRAEQTWLVYRNAYLEAMYPEEDKQANYGSIFPMEYALLATKLTHEHTAALKDLLRARTEEEASP